MGNSQWFKNHIDEWALYIDVAMITLEMLKKII